jgi:hypothetical protein
MIGGIGGHAEGEGDEGGWFDEVFEGSEPTSEWEGTMTVKDPVGGVKGAVWRAAENLGALRTLDGNEHNMRLVIEIDDVQTTYTLDTELGAHLESIAYIFTAKKSQEPDDSNPTPYLGGSMGPVLPEKDNDTGKVLPDADLGGFDGTVWKGTPDSDDSGKFYGGILGGRPDSHPDSGGARPIDPVRKAEDEANAEDEGG